MRLGIYYDGVIARIPIYEDDPRYGGLIVVTPPFNVFAVLMIPFYVYIKDKKKLIRMNDLFTKAMFMPIAIMITAMFMVINLILLPFAYFAAIFKKLSLLTDKSKHQSKMIPSTSEALNQMAQMQQFEVSQIDTSWIDLIFFIILGIPVLLLA